jgi:hypothetical protein
MRTARPGGKYEMDGDKLATAVEEIDADPVIPRLSKEPSKTPRITSIALARLNKRLLPIRTKIKPIKYTIMARMATCPSARGCCGESPPNNQADQLAISLNITPPITVDAFRLQNRGS